ncbi:unnamed protein product [Trichogramma brassicae]|uniref:Uncharacterized protein n=1 Tax=Trichogramma brassicae TaxID=86971 RepID=A0A6H5ISF8_9HYME|nr:unnamed protein product [Trichogramma brassicae]
MRSRMHARRRKRMIVKSRFDEYDIPIHESVIYTHVLPCTDSLPNENENLVCRLAASCAYVRSTRLSPMHIEARYYHLITNQRWPIRARRNLLFATETKTTHCDWNISKRTRCITKKACKSLCHAPYTALSFPHFKIMIYIKKKIRPLLICSGVIYSFVEVLSELLGHLVAGSENKDCLEKKVKKELRGIDNYDCEHVEQFYHEKLISTLKTIREEVNWEIDHDRYVCLWLLCLISSNWQGPLPKLDEIFRPKEIDWLLTDYLKFCSTYDGIHPLLIDFIVRCGFVDRPEVDEAGEPVLRRDTALLWADVHSPKHIVGQLFKIYNRYELNYTDEHHRTHFRVACRHGFDDAVEKFLEHGQDPNCLANDCPPLHYALTGDDGSNARTIELLLRHERADPNVTYQHGTTLLHAICDRRARLDVLELFFRVNDELGRTVRIDAVDDRGRTPLVLALRHGDKETAELLLRRGADPNLTLEDGRAKEGQVPLVYAAQYGYPSTVKLMLERGADLNFTNAEGLTALHMMCRMKDVFLNFDDNVDVDELVEMIFELGGDKYRSTDEIDARDNSGNTPLLLAARRSNKTVLESLLRRGADPQREDDDGMIQPFFEVVNDTKRTVEVDARDKKGRTALHLALRRGSQDAVESLLRNGADPNSADANGSTPLHVICSEYKYTGDDGLAEMLFKIVDDRQQLKVQVDARDKTGRTPLQWAVVRCNPYKVASLLNHGADLSNFVFPTESHFQEQFKLFSCVTPVATLRVITDLLIIVECLEKAGYEPERSEALTIIKVFDECALSETWEFLDDSPINLPWIDEMRRAEDEKFAQLAKGMMVTPGLSFHDLIQLPRDRAVRLVTCRDYFNFERNNHLWRLPAGSRQASAKHLSEIVSRRFYLEWALDPFVELIHYRLPLLCCDMILEELTNRDLFNICLANELSRDDQVSFL